MCTTYFESPANLVVYTIKLASTTKFLCVLSILVVALLLYDLGSVHNRLFFSLWIWFRECFVTCTRSCSVVDKKKFFILKILLLYASFSFSFFSIVFFSQKHIEHIIIHHHRHHHHHIQSKTNSKKKKNMIIQAWFTHTQSFSVAIYIFLFFYFNYFR